MRLDLRCDLCGFPIGDKPEEYDVVNLTCWKEWKKSNGNH